MIENPRIGDRVAYSDAANPRREGVVVEKAESEVGASRGSEYRVVWDDDGLDSPETWSDLRQNGWVRLDRPSLGTAIRRVERLMETARFSPVTNEALEVVLDAARKRG